MTQVLLGSDPGYYLINWVVAQFDGSIAWVNVACAIVLVTGVLSFARSQPLPWLAFFVAVPYLIIVVGMGYTRQSAALGFLLIGLVAIGNGRMKTFVIWVLFAATFHKSAVLLLPIAALASTSNRLWSFFWVGLVSLLASYFFILESVQDLWVSYVVADYQSQGGLIRVLMNGVPAILFLFFRRFFRLTTSEYKLWSWISLLSLICIPLVMLSSTATDRVALYLIPIQMFVFGRLPLIMEDLTLRGVIAFGVVCYYTLVQAVWLFFAHHAFAWLPYQNFLWS